MKMLKYIVLCLVYSLPSIAFADFFQISQLFEAAATDANNSLVHIEGFENNNLPSNIDGILLPPEQILEFGSPLIDADGLGFPTGLGTDLITIDPFGVNENNTWALIPNGIVTNTSTLIFGFGFQIEFFDDSIGAFGFDVDLAVDEPTLFEVRNTEGEILFSDGVTTIGQFIGFVADPGESIGSITLGSFVNPGGLPQVDNFQFWQRAAIPEPNSVVLVFCAVAGIALKRTRLR